MVQLVLDHTVGPYAYGRIVRVYSYAYGPNTRMVWNIYISVWYISHGLSFFSVLLNKEFELNLWIVFLIVKDILLTFHVFIIKFVVQSDFGNVFFGSEVLSLDGGLCIIQQ